MPWGYVFFLLKEASDVYSIIPSCHADEVSLMTTCGYDNPRARVGADEFLACFRDKKIIGYQLRLSSRTLPRW